MNYGAPSHRLEEYMLTTARSLGIQGQFLYQPRCMVLAFDDPLGHTTAVKLVRTGGGLNFGKLEDTYKVYKDVFHGRMTAAQGDRRLTEIELRRNGIRRKYQVVMYGLASASVGPFGFQAGWNDLLWCFALGCIVGLLVVKGVPRSNRFANCFEFMAAAVTSFIARAVGSIDDGNIFCFSALAQSSIALILPGYIFLRALVELQSGSIISGSARMVYAIMYSFFLGYGITVGTVLYGFIDRNAISETTCRYPIPWRWQPGFVVAFTCCLIVINKGRWKQAPVMVAVSLGGWAVTYFSTRAGLNNAQISSTLGALTIGLLANGYSRVCDGFENRALNWWDMQVRTRLHKVEVWCVLPLSSVSWRSFRLLITTRLHSYFDSSGPAASNLTEDYSLPRRRKDGYALAATAMLPAIFVQVPSGLAAGGSLVAGIITANGITHPALVRTAMAAGVEQNAVILLNLAAFSVGYTVVQVAIGITVGLFLSSWFVYLFPGKKKSALFSF